MFREDGTHRDRRFQLALDPVPTWLHVRLQTADSYALDRECGRFHPVEKLLCLRRLNYGRLGG